MTYKKYIAATLLSTSLMILSAAAKAQPVTPEAKAIAKLFQADSAPPGSDVVTERLFTGVKAWMGAYQGLQKDKEGNWYLVKFDRGSLPVSVRLDSRGQINSLGAGCPSSRSLNLNQASNEIKKLFSSCPGLKN
jgi:hypothetical protein